MHNMTFGYKFLCILVVNSCLKQLCLHTTWKIVELSSVMKWQFWQISFVSLHALLFWLRIEVVDPRFILNNKLWNKFLLGHIGIVREVHQKLVCSSGVGILDTIWQTLCSYAEMHKIFTAQKSHCAFRVLSLATIRNKYYFNFIPNRTRSGRELFDLPSYTPSDQETDWTVLQTSYL